MLDDDHQLVPHLDTHRRKSTLESRSGRDIDGLRHRDALVNLCNGVDFDIQTGCQLLDRGTPGQYQHPGPQQHRPVVERFAEPHHIDHDDRAAVGEACPRTEEHELEFATA